MDYTALTKAIADDAGAKKLSWLPPVSDQWAGAGSHSDWAAKMIETPKPTSPKTLAAFAHEAGHLVTSPATYSNPNAKRLEEAGDLTGQIVREWRATKWGMDTIKRHGGEVTDEMKRFYTRALMTYVRVSDPYDILFLKNQPEFPEIDHFMRTFLG